MLGEERGSGLACDGIERFRDSEWKPSPDPNQRAGTSAGFYLLSTYYVPGSVLSSLCVHLLILKTTLGHEYHDDHPHLADEETEAEKGSIPQKGPSWNSNSGSPASTTELHGPASCLLRGLRGIWKVPDVFSDSRWAVHTTAMAYWRVKI